MEKFKAMSTPKEKAEDLILKYSILNDGHNHLVKECAKIACDEILLNNPIALVGNAGKFIYMDDFWKQVKTEIDKL